MSITGYVRICSGIVLGAVAILAIASAPLSAGQRQVEGKPVSITLSATGAAAEGITPGGQAVWFVLSLDEFSGWPRLWRRVEITPDHDRDGRVELELKVRRSSVWVAVDFTTGAYAVARPSGAPPLRPLPSRGDQWAGGRAHVDFTTSELEVLLVRPGKAAWVMRCEQGGPRDGDRRADGNLRVRLADMDLIHGESGPPPVALPRDLLVAIDPTSLFTFVQSVAGAKE